MTDMLEKVARAIASASCGEGCPIDDGDMAAARAAIAVMREGLPDSDGYPWFELIARECESAGTMDDDWEKLKALAIWADQIEAALNEQVEK